MAEITYHIEAESEAMSALFWYSDKSKLLGSRFEQELLIAEQQVIETPTRWHSYLHGTRLFRLNNFPFALVYLNQESSILGIAVAHLHRKPGYWKERLAP